MLTLSTSTTPPAEKKPHREPTAHERTRRTSFRPDIEGLRAIAVLLVVLGHAGVPFLTGGYVGVDVFFVISGFLITSLLLRELADTGSISIRRFYARRAVRLLPASAVVIVATVAAAWFWLPPTRFTSILTDAVASGFYAINYRLAVLGTDYLASDDEPSPLQHFWSLAVEEQYYIVWPLLLLSIAVMWRHRRGSMTGPVTVALVAVAGSSFYLSVVQTSASAPWAYFGIHTRAWELALGALLAVFAAQATRIPRVLAGPLGGVGVALIFGAAVLFDGATVFPGYLALLPVSGTVLVIAAGCADRGSVVHSLLGVKPMQWIGKLSYGWYLWHWPVLMIGPYALGVEASVPVNLGLVLLGLAISLASYRLIENPVRHRRSLTSKPWRGIGLGFALSSMVVVVSLLAGLVAPSTTGTGEETEIAVDELTQEDLTDALTAAAGVRNVPVNLTPSLDEVGADLPRTYPDRCHLDFDEVSTEASCRYGDPDADQTMVLFGDSHAAHWFPALESIATDQGWELVNLTKSACPASDVVTYSSLFKRDYDECEQWRDESLELMQDIEPDMVVMATSDASSPAEEENADQVWVDGFVDSFRTVADDDTELFYLADTPNFEEKVPDCVAANLDGVSRCTADQADVVLQPDRRDMVTEALDAEDVTVVDPLPWFCAADTCPVVLGNVLMYRDSHHMTSTYSEFISPLLSKALQITDDRDPA
ncbi:acyltransferase family protein [Stackebrandtia endophytica]|uniref:acyltransferase family protein n=1 Tax=Stackebrandtia endophytica TaxID=1496996 RepID=UPI00147751AD|nr:acyltransferase family protein [Stackebrandtia endophytica]